MPWRTTIFAAVLIGLAWPVAAETPIKVRGTVTSIGGGQLRVANNDGGEAVVSLGSATKVTVASPTTLASITPGSFIGTAAQTQDDGTLVAVEVHVFADSMRGAGEGHRPFDLGPKSTMTNGTVGQEVIGTQGRTLTVDYKGGQKQVVVPPGVPVVALSPGDPTLIVPGAHVVIFVQKAADGTSTAGNVLVGKDGFVPPL